MIQQNFLRNEDRIVEVEGVRVRFDPDAEIQPGDLYIGERNSGPKQRSKRSLFHHSGGKRVLL